MGAGERGRAGIGWGVGCGCGGKMEWSCGGKGLARFPHRAFLHYGILRIERFRTGYFRTIRLYAS